ncbi:hypothetical protein ACFL6W_07215 [Thermodesulfobacteriota bacterium]
MMRSKVMSLLWENWRCTRWIFIQSCILAIAGRMLYLVGFIDLEASVTASKLVWFIGFSLLSLFLFIGHCEGQDLKLSFPEQLFRYPVDTRTLVAVYMMFGITAIAVQALIFFGFEMLFFDSVNFKWPYLLIFLSTYTILQTISWSSWIPGTKFHLLLAFLLCCSLCFPMYAIFSDGIIFSTGINALCLIIILICCGISFLSVSAHRHNRLNSTWKQAGRVFTIFPQKPSRPFKSALQAQTWFELRQTGHLFPVAFLLLIIMVLIIALVICLDRWIRYDVFLITQISNLIPFMAPLTIVAALMAGLFAFALYDREYNSGVSSFWMRRPLTTRSIAVARFKAIMISMTCVLVMLIVISLFLILYDWINGNLDINKATPVKWALKCDSTLETITFTILGLYAFILFYWTMLCIPMELLTGAGLAACIIWITSLLFGDTAAKYMANLMFAAVPVWVIIAFYRAKRRKLISTTMILISVFMFPLTIAALWAYPWFFTTTGLPEGLPDLNHSQIIYIIIGAMLPFMPIVATPIIIDKLRHR